jgi:hypothetical protein
VPYVQCPLYQANKPDQDARQTYYSIPGTPRVSVNGAAAVSAGAITTATIETAISGTSPVEVRVSETTATNRTVHVRARATGTIPTGNYRLYVAIVEKRLNFNANNGETVHHGVFRKFLTSAAGDVLTAFATNSNVERVFNYSVDATWNNAQTYVVAWLQNDGTKAVLNSGSRFAPLTGLDENMLSAQISVAPNPTQDKLTVSFTDLAPLTLKEPFGQYVSLQNANGQVIMQQKLNSNNSVILDVANFPSGLYFIKLQTAEGIAVKKFVKQ